jgi:hypothetical protein
MFAKSSQNYHKTRWEYSLQGEKELPKTAQALYLLGAYNFEYGRITRDI